MDFTLKHPKELKHATTIIFICLCLVSNYSSAQKRIIGKLVDVTTNEPLEFAHIGLENRNLGTVTNSLGDFNLLIEPSDETLVVTHVGYETKKIAVLAAPDDTWIIKMQPTVRRLDEVLITTDKQNIVEEAIAAIPQNYDLGPMVMQGFYRASIYHEDTVVQLSETAVEIFRTPKKKKLENNLRILKGRISRDSATFARLMNVNAGIGPNVLITGSFLEDHRVLRKKFMKNHKYAITDVTTYDGFDVYVVEFDVINNEVKEGYKGKMLIDVASLAFIQISYSFSDQTEPPPLFKGSVAGKLLGLQESYWTENSTELNYHKVNGKWYASHILYGSGWVLTRAKMNYSEPMTYVAEFVVTDINTENVQVPEDAEFAKDKILSIQVKENTVDFWADYNYLSPDQDYDRIFNEIAARNAER